MPAVFAAAVVPALAAVLGAAFVAAREADVGAALAAVDLEAALAAGLVDALAAGFAEPSPDAAPPPRFFYRLRLSASIRSITSPLPASAAGTPKVSSVSSDSPFSSFASMSWRSCSW